MKNWTDSACSQVIVTDVFNVSFSVSPDSSSSENSDLKIASIYADNETAQIEEKRSHNHAEVRQPRP
jgi:hypothetical protein